MSSPQQRQESPSTEVVTTNVMPFAGFLPSKVYDILKWVAQILIPAAGTLYFALDQIWGIFDAERIVGTLTAVDVFLGVVLGVSTMNYNKSGRNVDGDMIVDTSHPDKDVFRMALNGDPSDMVGKRKVTFRVMQL